MSNSEPQGAAPFHVVDLIRSKRDGASLPGHAIASLVREIVSGRVSEAQTGALLMAIFLRGLDEDELPALTSAMRFSGETFDARSPALRTVDKHSTGGVGDKTSLLLAPILAAHGAASSPGIAVPMISGRALGHTGGTLDKLETIPGFRTQLPLPEMRSVLARTHAVLVGQTPDLVPADRILYALRDHTGTVESPFLICASIMSKKLAAGLDALVLDVKTGSGAFMRGRRDARFLAELMVRTGERAGTRTAALLTSMDQPLGRFAGNWVEVWECADLLQNRTHPMSADLLDLTHRLAGWMLHLSDPSVSTAEAGRARSEGLLRSGAAFQACLAIVEAQGGDTRVFRDPAAFHQPAATRTLRADRGGYLLSMDCAEVGWAVQRLGAGRSNPGDPVDAHAGIEMHAKLGDRIEAGQPLVTLFAASADLLDEPESMLRGTLTLADTAPEIGPLVQEILTAESLGIR